MRSVLAALSLALLASACSVPGAEDDVLDGDQALDRNDATRPDRTIEKREIGPALQARRLVFTTEARADFTLARVGSYRRLTSTVDCSVFGVDRTYTIPAGATYTFGTPWVDKTPRRPGENDDPAERWSLTVPLVADGAETLLSLSCETRWEFPTAAKIGRALASGAPDGIGVVARLEEIPQGDAAPR